MFRSYQAEDFAAALAGCAGSDAKFDDPLVLAAHIRQSGDSSRVLVDEDGTIVGVFGVVPLPTVCGLRQGYVWVGSGTKLAGVSFAIRRQFKAEMRKLFSCRSGKDYHFLVTWFEPTPKLKRWAQHCGFTLEPIVECGVNRKPLIPAWIKNEDATN